MDKINHSAFWRFFLRLRGKGRTYFGRIETTVVEGAK